MIIHTNIYIVNPKRMAENSNLHSFNYQHIITLYTFEVVTTISDLNSVGPRSVNLGCQ